VKSATYNLYTEPMNNETLFVAVTLLDLCIVLLAWKFGKEWVIATIIANIILVSTFASKIVNVFGYSSTIVAVFYAAIFIATDILTEHHGKKVGYQSVWMGFLALATFTIMGQLALLFVPTTETATMSSAMNTLFSAVPRIAIASFTAYLIAQNFDIWLFHRIGERTEKRLLWLRNMGSTAISQFLDNLIFFPIAFGGTVPFNVLTELILVSWLVKMFVALLDTPFIYLSYVVKGITPPDFQKRKTSTVEAPATGL